MTRMTSHFRPASDKQIAFIERLFEERMHHPLVRLQRERYDVTTLDVRGASATIDYLMSFDRQRTEPVHEDGAALGEGYYLQEDTVYKVVKAKSTGNLYAKALHSTEYGRATWDYAPGAMKHLTGSHRLTLEQAAEMGTRLGSCVICGKALTDPESVERGIGPVCATRV